MTEAEETPRILETVEEVAQPAASSPSPARKTRKRRRLRWSDFSYTTRVTLAFALIAAMTALVAIGVVSFVWEQHFRTYTADNMQTLCQTTANRIAAIYKETDDLWNPETTKPALQAMELTSGVGVRVINDEGRNKEILGRIPAHRWGAPEDMKGLAIFLASAASDYVTGAVIPVDGGYLAK